MTRASLRDCAAIVLASALFYGIGIGRGSHFNSDDTLYAQMAREMLQSGDLFDNRWLGVVHFEKPPLLLWSLAAAGGSLGFDEGALRLPVTVFAIAGLCGFFLLARELGLSRRPAFTATGLLAVSTFYLLMTRRLMTDIPLLCCSLLSAWLVLRRRHLAAGACAGLALLAKGPAALPLLAAGHTFAATAGVTRLRGLLTVLAVALAVAAPWHIVESLRYGGEFWSGYLGHHLLTRMRQAVVPGLTLIELAQLLGRERVLLLLAAAGLASAVTRKLVEPVDRFACLWLLAAGLPLLASSTRLPHYLLPLTPALSLLAVSSVPPRLWAHRLAPLLACAIVPIAFLAEPAKPLWWLEADFSPNEKRIGQAIGNAADAGDIAIAYNVTNSALVFYSGRAVEMYADDPRFIAIQNAVLMTRRQAGRPGALHDLRATAPPEPAKHRRFVVSHRGADSLRAEQLLRAQAPARTLYRLQAGELVLLDDAAVGDRIEAAPRAHAALQRKPAPPATASPPNSALN
jgi:4-amino-4-deoxy-L-arabinose transferase-like glycosyltransferase